jgi:hypothetical protein
MSLFFQKLVTLVQYGAEREEPGALGDAIASR